MTAAAGFDAGLDRLVTIDQPPDTARGCAWVPARLEGRLRPELTTLPCTRSTIDKQQANGSGDTLVTFRLPAEVQATTVSVVGEFNGWSADAHRMRREGDAFVTVIPLVPGRAYQFRYLLDGELWLND